MFTKVDTKAYIDSGPNAMKALDDIVKACQPGYSAKLDLFDIVAATNGRALLLVIDIERQYPDDEKVRWSNVAATVDLANPYSSALRAAELYRQYYEYVGRLFLTWNTATNENMINQSREVYKALVDTIGYPGLVRATVELRICHDKVHATLPEPKFGGADPTYKQLDRIEALCSDILKRLTERV